MIRNIIKEKDEIKAFSFDRNGKIIASLYDSGFPSVAAVISELSRRGSGWMKDIKEISIENKSRCTYARYNKQRRRIL